MAGTLVAIVVGAAAWTLSLFNSVPVPTWLQFSFSSLDHTNYPTTLAPFLSPSAKIHLPGSNGFGIATDRWITWKNPHLDVVIEVATEEDVANTVRSVSLSRNASPFSLPASRKFVLS